MTDTTDPATESTKRTSRLGGWFSRRGRESAATPSSPDAAGAAVEPASETDSVDGSQPAADAPAADPGWLLHDGERDGYDGWLYHFADGVTVTENGEVVELAPTQPETQSETEPEPQAPAEPEPEPEAVDKPEPEAAPETEAVPEDEAQPEAVAEPEADDEPEPNAQPEAQPETQPEAQSAAQSEAEADAQLVFDLEVFTEASAAPEVEVEPKDDAQPEDDTDDPTDTKAESEPESEPEDATEADAEPEGDADQAADTEVDAEVEPETEADTHADVEPEDKTDPETEADSQPDTEALPEAAAEPVPEADVQPEPEQTDEADFPSFVEYSPSHLPLYALGAVFVGASVISVLMIFLAVQDGTTNSLLRAGAVLVIALAAAWLILGWEPTVVSVRDGLLEVRHGSRGQKTDLRDPNVIAESSGKPGSPAWKLTVRRPDDKPIVVRGYQVRRRPFARIVAWHQAHPHAEER